MSARTVLNRLYLFALAAVTLSGCQSSDRTINLGPAEITTDEPVAMITHGLPLAGSRDGNLIAIARGMEEKGPKAHLTIEVATIPSMKILGEMKVRSAELSLPMFSLDLQELWFGTDDDYIAWNFKNGKTRRLPIKPKTGGLLWWWSCTNWDRTIFMYPPSVETWGGPAQIHKYPGQVLTAKRTSVFDSSRRAVRIRSIRQCLVPEWGRVDTDRP